MSDDWKKYKAMIALRKNETGEIRMVESWSSEPFEDGEYIWTEGNYSCDCNRHLFFEHAGGNETNDQRPCGDTLYTALYGTREDGSKFEVDDVTD